MLLFFVGGEYPIPRCLKLFVRTLPRGVSPKNTKFAPLVVFTKTTVALAKSAVKASESVMDLHWNVENWYAFAEKRDECGMLTSVKY